jgi:hypothetical protein
MNFEEAYQKAVSFENSTYTKKFQKETLFKIQRRNSKQLYLCCRQDKTCMFSIRYNRKSQAGNVNLVELKQIHTCTFQSCRKPLVTSAEVYLKKTVASI